MATLDFADREMPTISMEDRPQNGAAIKVIGVGGGAGMLWTE